MIKTFNNIINIKNEIQKLIDIQSFSYCQSYIWLEGTEKFSSGSLLKKLHLGDLKYFCIYRDETLKLVAPLLIKKSNAYLLGYKAPVNYKNFIYSSDISKEDFKELFEYLKNNYNINKIFCHRVFDYNNHWYNLLNDTDCVKEINSSQMYNVQLSYNYDSFESYFKSLSKSTRQNYRTAINRINKDGLTFSFNFTNNPLKTKFKNANLGELFLKEHKKRVKTRYSKDNVNNNKIIFTIKQLIRFIVYGDSAKDTINDFIDRYYMESNDKNQLLGTMFINDKPAAFCYGLISENGTRINFHRVCLNEEKFGKYSPEMVLLIELIKNYSNCFKIFDFTVGQEEYKFKLGCSLNELKKITISI